MGPSHDAGIGDAASAPGGRARLSPQVYDGILKDGPLGLLAVLLRRLSSFAYQVSVEAYPLIRGGVPSSFRTRSLIHVQLF